MGRSQGSVESHAARLPEHSIVPTLRPGTSHQLTNGESTESPQVRHSSIRWIQCPGALSKNAATMSSNSRDSGRFTSFQNACCQCFEHNELNVYVGMQERQMQYRSPTQQQVAGAGTNRVGGRPFQICVHRGEGKFVLCHSQRRSHSGTP